MLRSSVPRVGVLLAALLVIAACAAETATPSAAESTPSGSSGGDVEAGSADTATAPASPTSDRSPVVGASLEHEPSVVDDAPSEHEPSVVDGVSLEYEPSVVDDASSEHEPSVAVEASSEHGSSPVVEPVGSDEDQGEPPAEVSVFPTVGEGEDMARWTVEIVESVPHDPDAFTQGLEVADGTMYESTGLRGRSSLRVVNAATGEVTAQVDLPEELFGEGLTVVGDELVQLTWQSGTALVYDRSTLDLVGEHSYEGEGWGLCEMGGELIMSDGSDRLARRDPRTFELLGTVAVTATGYDGRLDYLNELECVESLVIANVWQTDNLLVIDPRNGQVVASVDAGPLVDDVSQNLPESKIDVLNGVAVDEESATLWMTGKLWPRLYRVRVVEVP